MEGARREWAQRFLNSLLPMQKILCGALATALCSMAAAQVGNAFFVSPAGSDSNFGISPTQAFRTLGQAVSVATGPGPYSIHLRADGTYAAPASLQTNGISIVAYQAVAGQRPRITGTLRVDDATYAGATASRLENLTLENVVLPSGGSVEIRRCLFDYAAANPNGADPRNIAIAVERPDGTESTHVIEYCEFTPAATGTNYNIGIQNFGTGPVDPEGVSSLLIRSNQFTNVFSAIQMQSDDDDNCYPRIASNAVRRSQRVMYFEHCAPFCVNNSVDEFVLHGAGYDGSAETWGIRFESCASFECSNNIVWFVDPNATGNDDIIVSQSTGVLRKNHLSDRPLTTYPYVAGAFPRIPFSSARATGGNATIVQAPATMTVPFGSGSVRVDVPVDFEGDMRTTQAASGAAPTVAQGADQVNQASGAAPFHRLALDVAASNGAVDAVGNWFLSDDGSGSLSTQPVVLSSTGLLPGTSAAPATALLYANVLPTGSVSPWSAVNLHAFDSTLGSVTFLPSVTNDQANAGALVVDGFPVIQYPAAGVTNATWTIPSFTPNGALIGLEVHLQVASIASSVHGMASNRVTLRLTLDPAY